MDFGELEKSESKGKPHVLLIDLGEAVPYGQASHPGKTITEHAIDSINKDVFKQTYLPQNTEEKVMVNPLSKNKSD